MTKESNRTKLLMGATAVGSATIGFELAASTISMGDTTAMGLAAGAVIAGVAGAVAFLKESKKGSQALALSILLNVTPAFMLTADYKQTIDAQDKSLELRDQFLQDAVVRLAKQTKQLTEKDSTITILQNNAAELNANITFLEGDLETAEVITRGQKDRITGLKIDLESCKTNNGTTEPKENSAPTSRSNGSRQLVADAQVGVEPHLTDLEI